MRALRGLGALTLGALAQRRQHPLLLLLLLLAVVQHPVLAVHWMLPG